MRYIKQSLPMGERTVPFAKNRPNDAQEFAYVRIRRSAIRAHLDRADAIAHLQSLNIPVLVAIAENSPPKSKAEMLALAEVVNVSSRTLPGTLGLHEEYPTELYAAIHPFLESDNINKKQGSKAPINY